MLKVPLIMFSIVNHRLSLGLLTCCKV